MYPELAPCDLSPTLLEEKADIERALGQLNGRQAEVIAALYTVTNWTVREVAQALGVHHAAVCKHRDSAMRNLAKILA
jgi:DNA-directed RNA polymerase specialized sigma24 family protein